MLIIYSFLVYKVRNNLRIFSLFLAFSVGFLGIGCVIIFLFIWLNWGCYYDFYVVCVLRV